MLVSKSNGNCFHFGNMFPNQLDTSFWGVRNAQNGIQLVKERVANGRRQSQTFFSYWVIQKRYLFLLKTLEKSKRRMTLKWNYVTIEMEIHYR